MISEVKLREVVEYNYSLAEDQTPVVGNASATEDEAHDKEVEDEIIARLERGDAWAWATITVTAFVPNSDMYARDSLGCCSYYGYRDFEDGDCYKDMKETAFQQLIEKLQSLDNDIEGFRE